MVSKVTRKTALILFIRLINNRYQRETEVFSKSHLKYHSQIFELYNNAMSYFMPKNLIVVNNLGAGMLEVCSLPKKEALKYQVYGGAKVYMKNLTTA